MDTFQARLQSINVDGLTIDALRADYIVQYKSSLIGRHFKSIVQTISFTLHGLVDDEFRDLWVAAGHMCALLWYPEISNMDEYCVRLSKLSVKLIIIIHADFRTS